MNYRITRGTTKSILEGLTLYNAWSVGYNEKREFSGESKMNEHIAWAVIILFSVLVIAPLLFSDGFISYKDAVKASIVAHIALIIIAALVFIINHSFMFLIE